VKAVIPHTPPVAPFDLKIISDIPEQIATKILKSENANSCNVNVCHSIFVSTAFSAQTA
jgi:hypothetical protein